MTPFVTRFAPSPTGPLHLGHVLNAIYVWGLARAHAGSVILRIEDHDRGRYRPECEEGILDDLEWLGLHPDVGTPSDFRAGATPYRQSDCLHAYAAVADRLWEQGVAYACDCTRARLRAVDTDVDETVGPRYDGRCRERGLTRSGRGLRWLMPDDPVTFVDVLLGEQRQRPSRQSGDMLIRDRVGNWTYQFAVCIDDVRQDVTAVIRGEDLLASTGPQMLLRRALGETATCQYFHHPLIRDRTGRKLSKRDGDLGLRHLRATGISPQRVLGRAAYLGGLTTTEMTLSPADLPALFEGTSVVREP